MEVALASFITVLGMLGIAWLQQHFDGKKYERQLKEQQDIARKNWRRDIRSSTLLDLRYERHTLLTRWRYSEYSLLTMGFIWENSRLGKWERFIA
jgi:hypothetical protein